MNKLMRRRLMPHRIGESGITMIEVLAAMIVLSVGILAMAPMMVLSITGSRFSNDVTTIASAAQERIEAEIAKGGTYAVMPYTQTEMVDGKYSVMTEVLDETVDASIPSRVYKVDVTVGWTDDAGVSRTMLFTTYAMKK